MDRFAIGYSLAGFLVLAASGCGSKVADSTPASESAASALANATPSAAPVAVVSQFLDEVRRGGEDSRAGNLLTQQAQAELKRIGRSIEPIGSPDARFVVTRAESVPGEENSALVHSIWTEPNGDGSKSDFQVVWAVEEEPVGWRISGLAMEIDPAQDPVIIDFENGELMAKLLSQSDVSDTQASESRSQAAGESTISR